MCEDCDDYDDDVQDPHAGFALDDIIDAARFVEAELPGPAVSEDAWAVYFGRKGGCIDSRSFERMERSREAALVLLTTMRQRAPRAAQSPSPAHAS
ncbi:hypothetical protein LGR54_17510 [Ancylobacter sp. Lp-2]|uniref:hypothetical protein n=1 Tax=Ancylobacter sp. Lp-2 TaxID=2881339 RepID=UPI001E419F4B|nr:hypothetical protein [Ancylobacter sp. Lp-2]MCB4770409.1 hypothetical protein [Ancylobacter sp. Lp-2]